MIICIAGKNDIAVNILEFLLFEKGVSKNSIYVIPNKTDDGIDRWQKSLLRKAREFGIEISSLEQIYQIDELVFLSLEFDKIIDPKKFCSKELYNIHFSLLPKYKGMYTSVLPILNNENKTGVTLHRIDNGIDTGDIIDQIEFNIDFMDNARDLYFKYIQYGTLLMKRNLDKIIKKEFIYFKKQNFINSSYYSKACIDFKNIKIDLNQTAINIHNQIRAYNFREYQIPKVFEHPIISSKILNSRSKKRPGCILFENDIYLIISTVDFNMILYKDKTEIFFNACKQGKIELVNVLVQIPKIINVQDENGLTPIMYAVNYNKKEIFEVLIMNGADLLITDFCGKSVIDYAKEASMKYLNFEILDILYNLTN